MIEQYVLGEEAPRTDSGDDPFQQGYELKYCPNCGQKIKWSE